VQGVERACRVTKVERLQHLVASHTKPWRDTTNEERVNGGNGLLLTPTIDHLFDKGLISFEDKGDLIVSPVADSPSLLKMGIKPDAKLNVGVFSEGRGCFSSITGKMC
jgi:putative restriction endonuclease